MPVAIALFALAAAILAIGWIRKANPTLDLAVLLTLGVSFGHPFLHLDLGPIPVTLPRLLIGLMALRAVHSWLRGEFRPAGLTASEFGLYGYVVYVGIQLAATDWQYDENRPLSAWLFFLFLPSVAYAVLRYSAPASRDLSRLRLAIAAFGVYLALTAIAETRGWSGLVFPKYIMSAEYAEFLGRGRGPFLNPTVNGLMMGTSLVAGLTFWPQLGRFGRFAIGCQSSIVALGIYLTYTRSCWVAAGVVLIGGLFWFVSWRMRIVLACWGLVLGVPLLLELKELASSFKRDKEVTVEQMEESAGLRPLLAEVAWQMFQDRPLVGWGYGQYSQSDDHFLAHSDTVSSLQKVSPYVQHSVLLAILVETGLIGVGLLLFFTVASARIAWRLANSNADWEHRAFGLLYLAITVMVMVNGLVHDVMIIDGAALLWFAAAGIVMALASPVSQVAVAERVGLSPLAADRDTIRLPSGAGLTAS